ncbi:MAG: hypothetical protein CM1200mP28_18430 [Deltaproteobacteria bacterium]|nr:MAG: hypothetical protein CM1200mP28_18430 [Deltaproteobacteria bacterium]
MLFVRVYFPFALGYAISYFFRNANVIIESDLVDELGLGPADLGLLTSAYFFSFAAFQLPLGILLVDTVHDAPKQHCFCLQLWGD